MKVNPAFRTSWREGYRGSLATEEEPGPSPNAYNGG